MEKRPPLTERRVKEAPPLPLAPVGAAKMGAFAREIAKGSALFGLGVGALVVPALFLATTTRCAGATTSVRRSRAAFQAELDAAAAEVEAASAEADAETTER